MPDGNTTDPRPSRPVLGALFRPVADGPFARRQEVAAAAAATIVLAVVVGLDWRLNPGVKLGPAYLLPIVLSAWFGGRWPGYLMAVASTVVWAFVPRPPPFALHATVSSVVGSFLPRLIIYPAVVELLALLQDAERRLRRAVEQRTAELRDQVAERVRAETALRSLAAQLSAAEDAERRRVAHDIHDALSQMLGVVKLNLQKTLAESGIDARPRERLTDVVGMVDDLIGQTRDMTFELHPSMLDHFGLVPTLAEFAGQFGRRTGTEVTVTTVGPTPDPPPPLPLVSYLFRATKEVISNAVRHGRARELVVTIHWPDPADAHGRVRVVVDDDGGGFDPAVATAPHARRGLGLAGIAERLAGLGGQLRLESQPGHGARVILEVPLADPAGSTVS
jgi:signal transduction histidine kinase